MYAKWCWWKILTKILLETVVYHFRPWSFGYGLINWLRPHLKLWFNLFGFIVNNLWLCVIWTGYFFLQLRFHLLLSPLFKWFYFRSRFQARAWWVGLKILHWTNIQRRLRCLLWNNFSSTFRRRCSLRRQSQIIKTSIKFFLDMSHSSQKQAILRTLVLESFGGCYVATEMHRTARYLIIMRSLWL